jgi:hypothetical protein
MTAQTGHYLFLRDYFPLREAPYKWGQPIPVEYNLNLTSVPSPKLLYKAYLRERKRLYDLLESNPEHRAFYQEALTVVDLAYDYLTGDYEAKQRYLDNASDYLQREYFVPIDKGPFTCTHFKNYFQLVREAADRRGIIRPEMVLEVNTKQEAEEAYLEKKSELEERIQTSENKAVYQEALELLQLAYEGYIGGLTAQMRFSDFVTEHIYHTLRDGSTLPSAAAAAISEG